MNKINKFSRSIIKHPIIAIIIFISVGVIIQLVVQILYFIGQYYPIIMTKFSAVDSLFFWGSYLGSLIGALVVIAGVYITIQNSQEQTQSIIENGNRTTKELIINSREDVNETNRKNILPIIVINRIRKKYTGDFLTSLIEGAIKKNDDNAKKGIPIEKIKYEEKNIESYIFVISKNKIDLQYELTDQQEERISNQFNVKKHSNGGSIGPADYTYIPMNICNSGLGPAVNTCFTLYKDGNKGSDEYHITSIALSLKTNHDMKLSFFIDKPNLCIGKYIFEVEYSDIFSNKYTQSHDLTISENVESFDLEINQCYIPK